MLTDNKKVDNIKKLKVSGSSSRYQTSQFSKLIGNYQFKNKKYLINK